MKRTAWFLGAAVALALLIWYWTPIRMTVFPMQDDARYTWDQRYEVYSDCWRTIPLNGPNGKSGIWFAGGRPFGMEDVDKDYPRKVKLKKYTRVSNGNYVVFKEDGYVSVWSPELLEEWKKYQE